MNNDYGILTIMTAFCYSTSEYVIENNACEVSISIWWLDRDPLEAQPELIIHVKFM